MSNKLSSIIKSSILSVAILLTGGAWAEEPLAMWDGSAGSDYDFSNLTHGDYTLVNLGEGYANSVAADYSYLQVGNQDQKAAIVLKKSDSTAMGASTVIIKCENMMAKESANRAVLSFLNGNNPYIGVAQENTTGDHTSSFIWNNAIWNDNANVRQQGAFSGSKMTIALAYSYANGTEYYVDGTSICAAGGLRASGYGPAGVCIGGVGADGSGRFYAMKGMKITAIAFFGSHLSDDVVASYLFPSDIQKITVYADTSVSAIKAQFDSGNYKVIAVSAADGVTITVDEAFDNIVSVSSTGSVKLDAGSQPAASYFSGVDFSGVQGALLRSWITTNVVGFNFKSESGSDVSGALVAADGWIHDNNSANGTSTGMFSDGLSTLTWASSTTYQFSGSTILCGYLDDGTKNGNGAEVHLTNVPYATYDIILYCSSDQGSGKHLAKTVNGTTYTWDSTENTTVAGNGTWGQTQTSTPAYGTNALRIKNLTGPLTIYGGVKSGTNRGGIAAFEIINTTHEATISSAGEYTLAGLFTSVDDSGHYVINVNESATLNIGSATTVGGVTFNVAADKTLTLSGANTLTASSGIIVKGSGTVVAPAAGTLAGTVKGNGTLVYTTTPSGITLTDTNWKGVLWLKNCAIAGIVPANIGSANSTLRLTGVTGYFNNGGNTSTCEGTLDLQDDGDKKAFTVDDGWSQDGITIFGKLTGSGSLVCKTRDISQRYVFKDPSAFTGTINCERTDSAGHFYLRVILGDGASLAPRSGTITVVSGATATVAAGNTWNAWAINVNGTLKVGAGSTIPAINTSSTGVVQITSAGTATISGVKDNAISASLVMMGGNIAVVDIGITELTIPAENNITFFAMNGKLDLSGCTSLTTLKLNLGSGTTFDLANVTLPDSCTTVLADVGSARDLTDYTISNLGTATLGFSVTETNEEYGQGTFSVSNVPSGANVSVTRADGTTSNASVTDGTARLDDYGTVKISGAATAYDVTFTNTSALAYMRTSASVRNNSASVPDDYYNSAAADKSTGLYIYKTPWIADPNGNNLTDMGNFQDSMSLAVVGQMPSAENNTIFIHLGGSSSKNGFLIARSTEEDRVIVAYNKNSAVTRLTTMTVPNADSTRHVYIITKQDDTVNNKSVFTIYLDGIKWKTAEVSPILSISGGVQVGSDFGAQIRDMENEDGTIYVQAGEGDTGYVNCIRIYDRVLTQTEINQYSDPSEYPYTSPNGSSARTFTAASENWIDATPSSEVWANSDDTRSGTPLSGASLNVTAGVDTEVTVNLASEAHYESLTVGGASTTFAAGTAAVKVIGMTVIGTTVTNEYGAVDMTGGPMTITEDGDITFDYSAYDISTIYTTTDIPLTSDVDEDSTKVHLIAPSASYRTVSLVYTSGHYAMRVTPDHEAGTEVYYKSGYFGKGGDSPFTVVLSDGTTPTVVFEGDTVVIDDKSSQDPIYIGELPDNVEAIKIARTCRLASGSASNAMLDGAVVTVADGVVATVQYNYNSITLGDVAFNKVGDSGTGSVAFDNNNGTLSVSGAVTGTAPIEIAAGKTVNVPSTGSIANAVTGAGRIVFEGALPSGSALLTSLQDSSNWTGTVELKNYAQTTEIDAHKIINLGNYGNSSSTVALNGVTSTMYTGNNTYPDVTLGAIEIGEGGWSDNDGLSYTVSPLYKANLTGHGTITVKTGNAGTVRFVGDNHTFNGSVAFGANTGKQVAFMKTDSDTLPSVTAKAIVVAGRTNMSIASGKTWTADAIKLDGSLTVLTDEAATATSSVAPTAYLDGASLTTTVDGEAGTTTYVTDEVTQISDNQASLGAVTVSEPKLMTGSGGAYMSSLTINDGATLTYDPVITPLRVETAPVFNGTGKLKLAPRYAGVTCGKFHLVSYPSSASVSGTLANVIDSSSFAADVSYTVTEETVGSYKQLVLKVGDYDNKAKPVSIAQFGDSITEGIWRDGYRGTPNYRIPLMQLLEAYGYKPEARGYRKVGSTDANGVPADSAYEYHTGISAQRIYTGLTDDSLRAGFMESIEAHLEQVGVTDIITLKIGTNDSLGGEEPDNMFEGWTNLVWKIVRMRPTSKIVVCAPVKIMKSGKETSESNAASLRTKIADYVDLTYEQGGFPNGQVTMINGFNIVTGDANYYLTDNIHPNWNGHLQLANGWFPAVTNAIESMTARAADAYTAQTVASAADVAELAAYRAGYVKLATFTNVWTKLSTWSESPYYYVNEAFTNTPMSRVAYFVARKTTASPDTRYVWVDMDADATTGTKLVDFGVPTSASVNGVVTNLHIYSNSSAIENVAPNVSGVRGTLMRTEKGVNKANGISTDLVPDGPYGFDWNDSINGSGAWGVMNMARIFDGATPNNHRKLLAAQMLFDFNGFNGARQNALGLGNFAVHGPYNTPNGSVNHFNLNWTFTTDKDEMPTMDARALATGVIEIWGFVAMPNEGGTDAGYIDGTTAVITNTTSSVTVPAGATAVAVSFSTGDAITLTSESLDLATSGVTVYATDAYGAKTATDITAAFKVTAGANNTYTVELDPDATVEGVSVTPEVDTAAETAPMAFDSTAPVFTVKTIPGLWYVVASGATLESLMNGTPEQADDSSRTLAAPDFEGTVQYYKVKVGPSKASVQ